MEHIVIDIKGNMHMQNQKLQKINNNLGSINEEMTISNRVMRDIRKNRKFNKLLLYGVASMIGLSLFLIVYYKVIA